MSRDHIVVTLTAERMARAKARADAQAKRHPEDRGDFAQYGGVPRLKRLEQAQMAREAVAQHFGRKTLPRNVKVQWDPHRPEAAFLKVPHDAKPGMRWVLVTGWEPTFTLIGGATPQEAPELGEWRNNVARPAWYIAPDRLHPLKGRE